MGVAAQRDLFTSPLSGACLKFDSSKKGRGQPATFPLGDLIKGWQMMVPGMKVGGTRRMELPHEFAYGERGSPPDIPAKATLVFEIEVKATKK